MLCAQPLYTDGKPTHLCAEEWGTEHDHGDPARLRTTPAVGAFTVRVGIEPVIYCPDEDTATGVAAILSTDLGEVAAIEHHGRALALVYPATDGED